MKAQFDLKARKRAVNLTLNEDLVRQARETTDNLSAVVESLLADFVEAERQRKLARTDTIGAAVATWNDFDSRYGSFADEHSTL